MGDAVGRRTVKSRCPICDGVIDSVPVKYGFRAMAGCPHCATMVVLKVEDTPDVVALIQDEGYPANGVAACDIPTPDYRLSFGGRFSIELERQGYKLCGTCIMDNGITGVVYRPTK